MRYAQFLVAAALCFLPALANAQSLAIADGLETEYSEMHPNISFRLVEPDHRFLPDGYKPPDAGYELRTAIEAALNRTLNGIIEYRWNEGGNPTLNIAGVPAGMKIRRNTVILGVNSELN